MAGAEQFTAQEEQVLSRYVTNLYGDVFVLINLPEVIKGALFSRYSRSTKGLRRLLLDEFIANKELGLSAVADSASESGEDPALARKKAEEFYDRILDGYGDDSVGELGAVHVALENISNIATKAIQDCRIGGSPLEKSSRYVWYNKKVNDDYHFLKEKTVLSTAQGSEYLAINRLLFATYDELIEPMTAFFKEHFPREEGVPDAAYNASIRARACDAIRGLLPASTLTNMGVLGNGRFFETLITKLRQSELAELRHIGEQLFTEISKVMPSFVRRGEPMHRHFIAAKEFRDKSMHATGQWAQKLVTTQTPSAGPSVTLIDYDVDAEDKILASLIYPYTHEPLATIRKRIQKLDTHEREQILSDVLGKRTNRRHKPPRAFENAYYTFDITADFGCYRDLERHRMLTQERQLLSVAHSYELPAELMQAGFADKFVAAMDAAADAYKAIARTHPLEAQYVVPFAYHLRWYFTINARSLYWLCELRSQPQGHPAYRKVAQLLYSEAKRVHPSLFAHAQVDMQEYVLGRLKAETKKALKEVRA